MINFNRLFCFAAQIYMARCYSRNGQKGDDNGGDDGFIEWFSKQQNKTLKWYFIQEKVYENFIYDY